ncbi:hypothetical protein [Mycobacterium sp. SMC-4]|uniref:hypothetical protein n=1 Tax=Mycobacterium sp. SMC-4 TaxID=2857059 RepID=UPI003D058989
MTSRDLDLPSDMPVTGAIAKYRGAWYRIAFSTDDWVALRTEPDDEIPDSFESGESAIGFGHRRPWVKVPTSVVDEVVHLNVSGALKGHRVSLRHEYHDGRIGVEFIGSPSVARELGLDGDQYLGWTGVVAPEDLQDIRVDETRRD